MDNQPEPNANRPRTKEERFPGIGGEMLRLGATSEFVDEPAREGMVRTDTGSPAFGAGNTFAKVGHLNAHKKAAEYRKAIQAAVTLDDIKDIVLKLVENAKRGDLASAQEIFNRTAGKVTEKIEVEGADGSGWSFTFNLKQPEFVPPPELPEVIDAPAKELPPQT